MFGVSLADFVSGWSAIQQASWTFSCPVHCSSSVLPWFLVGLCLGFVLCLLCCVFGLVAFYRVLSVWFPVATPPSGSRVASGFRLRGYLHEH